MDKKRKITQIISAIIGNANISGLFSSTIYRGKLKSICFPGLNCYSCPAALGACPLGSLQSLIMSPSYVLGFLIMTGIFLGRVVCGFLCPFGLFQEALHIIPSKKIRISSKFLCTKYVVLVVFVIILPVYAYIAKGYTIPAFCKYICPSGTIFAGFPLLTHKPSLRLAIGGLFALKTALAVLTVAASIAVIRPFCRFVCPLGAIFGFFNKYSVVQIYKNDNCVKCGKCEKSCDIFTHKKNKSVQSNAISTEQKGGEKFQSPECIRCMKCANACGTNALKIGIKNRASQYKFSLY